MGRLAQDGCVLERQLVCTLVGPHPRGQHGFRSGSAADGEAGGRCVVLVVDRLGVYHAGVLLLPVGGDAIDGVFVVRVWTDDGDGVRECGRVGCALEE